MSLPKSPIPFFDTIDAMLNPYRNRTQNVQHLQLDPETSAANTLRNMPNSPESHPKAGSAQRTCPATSNFRVSGFPIRIGGLM